MDAVYKLSHLIIAELYLKAEVKHVIPRWVLTLPLSYPSLPCPVLYKLITDAVFILILVLFIFLHNK